MGSSASRPRPGPGEAPEPPYPDYGTSGPPGPGPYFLGGPYGGYRNSYQNNGQFYGGFQAPNGQPPQSRCSNFNAPQSNTATANADKQLGQTATIRNAVNVKKGTIKVTPSPTDSTKLAVSFQFDASAACMVSVFIAAKEDANDGCRIIPTKQQPVAGTHYEKGLGLVYPKDGAAAQAIIDLSQYSASELLGVQEGVQYPLVIRLETVTEKGLSEGHSLSELSAGGPQRVWVQSQTTFAQLSKEEEGKFAVRPLKQKIWVEGVSYELQEIYGIEHATAAAKEREGVATTATPEQEEERNCVICMVNARDTTVLPCRHMCMCHDCAHELRKQTSKCPICRNHVESLLHIRMMRQQAALAAQADAAAAKA